MNDNKYLNEWSEILNEYPDYDNRPDDDCSNIDKYFWIALALVFVVVFGAGFIVGSMTI